VSDEHLGAHSPNPFLAPRVPQSTRGSHSVKPQGSAQQPAASLPAPSKDLQESDEALSMSQQHLAPQLKTF